jgi:hypothetical protein
MLTGAGERAFCTGGDISGTGGDPAHGRWVREAPMGHGREMREGMQAVVAMLRRLDKPSVAAVRGYAVAAGWRWRSAATSGSRRLRPSSATAPTRWACCPTKAARGCFPAPWASIAR